MALPWDIPDRPIDCRLLHLGRTTITLKWKFTLRSHYWRLYANAQRGAAVEHPVGITELEPDHLYLLPAWGEFQARCRAPGVDHLYIHFLPQGLVGEWARDWLRQPIAVPRGAVLSAMVDGLGDRPPGPGTHLHAAALVTATLATALDVLAPDLREALATHLSTPSPVDPAVDRIRHRPGEDLKVATLAAHCALSPDHFARLFKRRTGRTPRQYVSELRVSRAAEQLLAGADSIEQIAEKNGFTNRYHFTRVFSKIMGRAPAAYRKGGRV